MLAGLPLWLPGATPASEGALRVQLSWSHQAEFAGLYVAAMRQYFENEGLDVEILEGAPHVDAVERVQSGAADVAIDWMTNAIEHSRPGVELVNVAQEYAGSSLVFVCRRSAGIHSLDDVAGREVGVWGIGDEEIFKAVLKSRGIDPAAVTFKAQAPDARSFRSGEMPCVSATKYNEYWSILRSERDVGDLLLVDPAAYGIPHFDNGLYVLASRLESERFVEDVAKLVDALGRGWRDAKQSPALALEATRRQLPPGAFDQDQQRFMIEAVLDLVADDARFGYFDIAKFEHAMASYLAELVDQDLAPVWTHRVWNELREAEGREPLLTDATLYYADRMFRSELFFLFTVFGIVNFALSGVIEAMNRGYDLWGRLILAAVSGIGGGTIRDVLIGQGGSLFFVRDPTIPVSIAATVLLVSCMAVPVPDVHRSQMLRKLKSVTDILGFAVLAVVGAQVAISANLPLIWAPFCAALTCAGGGALRDIATNSQPRTFQGVIYEEVAVVGGIVYVVLLLVLQENEHTATPAILSALSAMIVMIFLRTLVQMYDLRYPAWLLGRRTEAS